MGGGGTTRHVPLLFAVVQLSLSLVVAIGVKELISDCFFQRPVNGAESAPDDVAV